MKALSFLMLGALVFSATESQAASICSLIFGRSKPVVQAAAPVVQAAAGIRTSAYREARLKQTEDWQTSMIDGSMLNGKNETPPMYFEAEEGVHSDLLVRSGGLDGVISHLEVQGLKEGDVLRGTILLPVSGHDGLAKAQAWATADKFDVQMQIGEGPNGDQFPSYDSPKPIDLIKQRLSTGLVSHVDLEIPVPPAGKQVRLVYYRLGTEFGARTGMGVPGGYPEGRLYIISFVP